MKLDVSGRRPWPGPEWDAFRVLLDGSEHPSPFGLADGEAADYSLGVGQPRIYAFGIKGPLVTPPGRQPRREPHELRIDRIEIALDGSPARLIADFPADRVYLEIGEERSRTRLETLLGALRLVQLPPRTGRPAGSAQLEDIDGLRQRVDAATARLRRDHRRVSVRAVADEIGYNESTLSKKLRRLGIALTR